MVTITGMTEHYRKAFSEDQAKVLAEATVLIEADLVRREDFSKLTATVERLAEAQERTEQRMDSLALGLAKLAEAMGQPHDGGLELSTRLGRKLALIFHHLVSHSDFSRQGWSQVGI